MRPQLHCSTQWVIEIIILEYNYNNSHLLYLAIEAEVLGGEYDYPIVRNDGLNLTLASQDSSLYTKCEHWKT